MFAHTVGDSKLLLAVTEFRTVLHQINSENHTLRVVFVRQLVHLTTHFFSATDVKHVLAELLVSDEPVVDTQVELLLAFLLERIRDVVLAIPGFFP